MKAKPKQKAAAGELRRSAEAQLKRRGTAPREVRSAADTERLLHELEVHQIELEMQNEELERARIEVEATLEKYSDLYDFAPVGYLTLDRAGAICEANLTSAALLGIERARLRQLRLALCVAPEDQAGFGAFLMRTFAGRSREFCEVTLLPTGKPPMQVRIEAVVAENGQECRAVVSDITAHKRAEADRLVLNKLESIGVLAAGIAHDFNNLLTVVALDVELAEALVPAGGDAAQLLGEAKKATAAAGALTRQFLTFAKGGAPVRMPTELPEVIRKSAQVLKGSTVRCEFSVADDLWLGEVDEAQIGQVFQNLFQNAKEAMPGGGVIAIRMENVVLGSREGSPLLPGYYVRVTVVDEGGGIAPDALPKIFDPYYSTKERGTQRGMGLGLTVCHTIVRDHGGAIAVASQVGAGSSFQVDLPASAKRRAKKPSAKLHGLPRHGRILVMDDEEQMRRVMGLTLWGLGQEVEVAADGEKAIELYKQAKARKEPFDVVILDLTVRGGAGGLETLQKLLKFDPAVKAVVMSGYADDPVIQEFERHGFKGVVVKPFGRQNLQEVLVRVMGSQPDGKMGP